MATRASLLVSLFAFTSLLAGCEEPPPSGIVQVTVTDQAGARVSGSVVMGHVGDGAVVVDSVLGAGAVVDAGEHLVGHRRPDPDGA